MRCCRGTDPTRTRFQFSIFSREWWFAVPKAFSTWARGMTGRDECGTVGRGDGGKVPNRAPRLLLPRPGQPRILKIETWSGTCLLGPPLRHPRPFRPRIPSHRPNRQAFGPRFTFQYFRPTQVRCPGCCPALWHLPAIAASRSVTLVRCGHFPRPHAGVFRRSGAPFPGKN